MAAVVALGGSDCERIGAGLLAQPVNAVSSLAYLVAAAVVLGQAGATAGRQRLVLSAYAGTLVAVGVGSVAYHGPQPAWAGRAHDGAIVAAVAAALTVAAGSPWWRRPRVATRTLAGLAGLALLAAGAYVAGRTGSPTCRPDSLLQPHAGWHLVSAAAAVGLTRAGGGAVPARGGPHRRR